jgi:hypothetical protein
MSESKTRSVAAIGNSRVIPAQAGIQRRAWQESHWIPAFAGMTAGDLAGRNSDGTGMAATHFARMPGRAAIGAP